MKVLLRTRRASLFATSFQEVTVRIVATNPRVAPVIRRLLQTAPLTSSATGYSIHSCSCWVKNYGQNHEGIVRSGMSISGGWERKPPGYPSCLRNVIPVDFTRSCALLFSCHVLSLLLYGIYRIYMLEPNL